ncbi:hypothetical protein H1S01_08065 [Heliobacterium chlorum]|uniref:Uncharacterized protein n=1 Tax=Heliobacterium chlorum TaxID=2698 RepID=A0ABR7T3A5_HELCL|nr:DUF6470 family protein [Heliobacterium chlorum]MBC9784465.1 hypothetical protein [Heliobacterium chlorum]
MEFPRIQIEQQFTRIQAQTIPRRFELHNELPQLTFERSQPHVEITRTPPQVQIDQTAARASVGFRKMVDLEAYQAQLAMQNSYEYIEKKAEEGDRIGAIENKENPIPDIALESAFPETPEINIASLPAERPQIDVTLGQLSFNFTPSTINYQFTPGSVSGEYQPSRVSISVVQQGYVKITPPPPKISLTV